MKITTETVVAKFKSKHGDKYDYSKVNYIHSKEKLTIICKKHGEFYQTSYAHYHGSIGCMECIKESSYHTKESLISKFNEIHGDKYDYSNIDFKNTKTPITIVCKNHGVFKKTPDKHLQGSACPECYNESLKYSSTDLKEIIKIFQEVHGNKYDYSKIQYKNSRSKVEILCDKHGAFFQLVKDHGYGYGCPSCKSSKGEIKIRAFLESKNIHFKEEFPICINFETGRSLRADFYIPSLNMCIEYDGIQHFKEVKTFGGKEEFLKTKQRDALKEKYCEDNNIKIIRIPYFQYGKIENILNDLIH